MARMQPKKISVSEKNEILGDLWQLVSSLQSKKEVEKFFKDLLSDTEAIMLGRRLQIAKFLLQDKSYDFIKLKIGASHSTIAKVHRWLQGDSEYYKKSIPILQKKSENESRKHQKYEPFSFEWLRRRYPLHFLLFNMFDKNYKK